MADLEINFQCMCLFVPEPAVAGGEEGTVHVLMPKTNCCSGAGANVPEHVVRLIHPDFAGTRGVPLEGWMLELGGGHGSADISLAPPGDQNEATPRIVDLTEFTGLRVPGELLSHGHGDVNARVVLRRGHLQGLSAEAHWKMNNTDVVMASGVTWRIEGVSGEDVRWTGPQAQGGGPVDILNLRPLEDGDEVIRFGIHHQPDEVLDTPDVPRLEPAKVTDHFRAFYSLFGLERPADLPLPVIQNSPPGDLVHCGAAKALLG